MRGSYSSLVFLTVELGINNNRIPVQGRQNKILTLWAELRPDNLLGLLRTCYSRYSGTEYGVLRTSLDGCVTSRNRVNFPAQLFVNRQETPRDRLSDNGNGAKKVNRISCQFVCMIMELGIRLIWASVEAAGKPQRSRGELSTADLLSGSGCWYFAIARNGLRQSSAPALWLIPVLLHPRWPHAAI